MRSAAAHPVRNRRRHTRVTITLLVLLFTAGLVWGLATALASDTPSPAASSSTLKATFGTTFDADNLNPFIGYSGTSYEIFHLNYDFLVGYNTDLSPRPELATKWVTSPDGKVWTFTLRQGVKWQDGQPFTAADVVFTYTYIIKNNLTAFTSYTNNIVKVEAVDDFTVKMTCSQPKANMLRLWIPIIPEHIWSKVPGKTVATSFTNKPPIIGTGPFQTVEVKKGEYIKLVKNPYYWIKGKPTIDQLVISIYQNPDTMTQDLKTGTLDYALGIPTAQFKALGSEPGLQTNAADLRYFDELCMNCYTSPNSLGNPVLRDPAFRQAISWAVDKQKVVDIAYGGYAKVGQSIITPDVPTYAWEPAPEKTFGFDLEKAKQMLDAAGYKDTNGDGIRDYKGKPITLRLWARTDDVASQSSGKLAAGWFKSIGLKITLQTLDSGAISDALYNYNKAGKYAPDYDIYIWGWGEYVDPDYILNVYTTGQIEGWNDPIWSNSEYDKLYEQQAQTLDPAQRKPLVDHMLQIFYDEAPYIVTNYEQQLEAYNTSKWEGWTRVPTATGPAAFINDNIDTYVNLKPKTESTTSKSSGNTLIYAVIVLILLIVVVVAVVLLRRGRARSVEE
jgi:peptide/nickel transport system substrate-binding protein